MQPSERVIQPKSEFQEQPYRWVIVSIYVLLTLANNIAGKNVPPIATKLEEVYGVSPIFINAVPMAYLLCYPIINLPANYLIDTKGLRTGLIVGSVLAVIGTILEIFVNYNFSFLFVGSFFVALSQPFILNCPAKIASFWFRSERRPIITSILSVVSIIGGGIGILLPNVFVSQDSTGATAQTQFFNCLVAECALNVVAMLLIVVYMRDKPKIAASFGSGVVKTPFVESIKDLWGNSNFRMLFFGFILFYGPLTTLTSVLNFLFKPFNFQNIQISVFGIGILLSGIIGAVIFPGIVSKNHRYSLMLKLLSLISLVIIGLIVVTLKFYANFGLILVQLCLAGFLVLPITPISFELGCETAFPVGQAQITGALNGANSLISFVLILIIELTIGFGSQDKSYSIFIILIVLMFVGLICFWLLKDILLRRDRQEQYMSTIQSSPPTNQEINAPQQPNSQSSREQQLAEKRLPRSSVSIEPDI